MLVTAAKVLRERGPAGVTIDEVLSRSGAPRGSVYYHFPHGRNQILTEALNQAGDAITAIIDAGVDEGGVSMVRRFVEYWEHELIDSDFSAGCPVMAAAVSSSDDSPELASVAGDIFRHWRAALTEAFRSDGLGGAEATSLARTCIAALEGAVVLARSTRALGVLSDVAHEIEFLIRSRQFVHQNAPTDPGRAPRQDA